MSDFESVKKALASGADPSMICATCPWDRNCVTPPAMTSADIEGELAAARLLDQQQMDKPGADKTPAVLLMTMAVYAGKDTAAQVCPVFALRLKSSGGRKIADGIRESMQAWDDAS